MQCEGTLILSAGFGTRMGSIGELLPKVLWPIFDLSILELQILRVLNTDSKEIYVNGHHLFEQVSQKLIELKKPNVNLIHEREILGTGGAIYNLAKEYGKNSGWLQIQNCDVFLDLDWIRYQAFLNSLDWESVHAVLVGIDVKKGEGFSQLECDESDRLNNIILSKDVTVDKYITYSGVGAVNLELMDYQENFCSFFNTVADYKNKNVVVYMAGPHEFWDFGSLERYHRSMMNLLEGAVKGERVELLRFCERVGAFNSSKLDRVNSNYGKAQGHHNLLFDSAEASFEVDNHHNIVLRGAGTHFLSNSVIFGDKAEIVPSSLP